MHIVCICRYVPHMIRNNPLPKPSSHPLQCNAYIYINSKARKKQKNLHKFLFYCASLYTEESCNVAYVLYVLLSQHKRKICGYICWELQQPASNHASSTYNLRLLMLSRITQVQTSQRGDQPSRARININISLIFIRLFIFFCRLCFGILCLAQICETTRHLRLILLGFPRIALIMGGTFRDNRQQIIALVFARFSTRPFSVAQGETL